MTRFCEMLIVIKLILGFKQIANVRESFIIDY